MIQTTNIEKVIRAIKKNKPILIKNFIDTSSFYKSEIKNLLNELEKKKKSNKLCYKRSKYTL